MHAQKIQAHRNRSRARGRRGALPPRGRPSFKPLPRPPLPRGRPYRGAEFAEASAFGVRAMSSIDGNQGWGEASKRPRISETSQPSRRWGGGGGGGWGSSNARTTTATTTPTRHPVGWGATGGAGAGHAGAVQPARAGTSGWGSAAVGGARPGGNTTGQQSRGRGNQNQGGWGAANGTSDGHAGAPEPAHTVGSGSGWKSSASSAQPVHSARQQHPPHGQQQRAEPVRTGGGGSVQDLFRAACSSSCRATSDARSSAVLPIASHRDEIVRHVCSNVDSGGSVVTIVTGETGSGKTTQVPQFILQA